MILVFECRSCRHSVMRGFKLAERSTFALPGGNESGFCQETSTNRLTVGSGPPFLRTPYWGCFLRTPHRRHTTGPVAASRPQKTPGRSRRIHPSRTQCLRLPHLLPASIRHYPIFALVHLEVS